MVNQMSKQTIDAMVDGGKATPGPPIGPALSPLKVNIVEIVAKINEKTKSFAGIKVPVKIVVDKDTKEYDIIVGSPPTSQLIKKEVGLEKLSGKAGTEPVADLKMQQIIKIAMMKHEAMNTNTRKTAVKNVIGTCVSAGILVEGKNGKETIPDVDAGKYDELIDSGKTELSAEELKEQAAEKKKLAADADAIHKAEDAAKAEALTEKSDKDATASSDDKKETDDKK